MVIGSPGILGKIMIDGKVGVVGQQVDKNNKVCYNNKIIPFFANYIYLALNKPVGYVCSRRQQGETPTIFSLLPPEYQNLKTVGRLDKDSSGLILLTNDGDFAYRMTHPKFYKDKIYIVELNRPLEPLHQQLISDFGVEIGDGFSKLGLIRLDDTRKRFQVTMHEGRNRQIRRTFESLGYSVKTLERTVFGRYELSGLKVGKFTEVKNYS